MLCLYCTSSGAWQEHAIKLPEARRDAASCVVDDRLIFAGGTPFKNTILWVSETEYGTLESTLPVALSYGCSVPLNVTCKEVVPENLDISIVDCATKS